MHRGFLITTAYIKKRNLLCLLFDKESSFSALSEVKDQIPIEYHALKALRDQTFAYWRALAGPAQREILSRLSKGGIPSHLLNRIMQSVQNDIDLYILKSVDTMRFPNEGVFRMRLNVLIKRKIRNAFNLTKEVSPGMLTGYDEENRSDDEIITANSINPDNTESAHLIMEAREKQFDMESFIRELDSWKFEDEAEYVKRIVGLEKGRISKYEVRKIKGSIRFLILSYRRKKDEIKAGDSADGKKKAS